MQDDIEKADETLRRGGLILYPTDTVWGIGCDATCEEAVARVYAAKRRNDSKALIVLIDSTDRLRQYIGDISPVAVELLQTSNRPLTVIYPSARNLAANLMADDGTVGIRITNETFSQELCHRFGKPIVSTSANFSGELSPANFSEINPEIIRLMDYTVNFRRDDIRRHNPSSIVKILEDGSVLTLRE